MDPNALLDEIRTLSDRIIYEGGFNKNDAEELGYKIAELDPVAIGGAGFRRRYGMGNRPDGAQGT